MSRQMAEKYATYEQRVVLLPRLPRTVKTMRHTIRILLVEDCRSDVYIVEKMLRDAAMGEEFQITNAPRLADAFKLLDEKSFDIIMLDLNLLDIDGVASVAALNAEKPGIPIIVYSGTTNERLREDALMCGARHFLIKGRESGYSLRFVIKEVLAHREPA